MSAPFDQSAFIHGVFWDDVRRYQHGGLHGIAVYDWLLCLDRERQFLLTRGFSRAKLAYILCRFWPLIAHPVIIWVTVVDHDEDQSLCARTIKWPMILQVGNSIGVGSILILRVHAFVGGALAVTWFLITCLLGDVAYQLWVAIAKTGYDPNVGCHPVDVGKAKHMGGYIIAPLLFDSIAFIVTMMYAFAGTPTVKGTSRWRLSGSFYTRVFIRDGIAYFVAIMVVHCINVVLNSLPDRALAGAGIPSSLILPNILACRLFLHLRHAAPPPEPTHNGSTHLGFASVSRHPQTTRTMTKTALFPIAESFALSPAKEENHDDFDEVELDRLPVADSGRHSYRLNDSEVP